MTTLDKKVDVLGLGCAAIDEVLYVSTYPERDGKIPVERRVRRFGGLTGLALVAAARLGARCSYAGQLGRDEDSNRVRENFIQEGIDVSNAPCLPDARVIHATVVVAEDDGSRCIFYDNKGAIGAHPTLPDLDCILASRVVLMDHYGITGNLRAAQAARAAGIGVVADFEEDRGEEFRKLLGLVDHLILSHSFATTLTSQMSAAAAARALWNPDRAAVIVTCGAQGCWSVDSSAGKPAHHPAFAVKAKDTTGCGDVFHGAYAAALAREDSLADRIRFAGAAAALRARQSDTPRRKEVEHLLGETPLLALDEGGAKWV